MTTPAEISTLVPKAAAPQCPHCKYFTPGTGRDPGGKCRITMHAIQLERQDYDEDQSCGAAGRWFQPRDESDEPVASGEPEPEPEERAGRSVLFAFTMWCAGVLCAFLFLGMLK